jgi:MarR family transcriptional regulator, lower aerobic nicotinate degradation pathway regulator
MLSTLMVCTPQIAESASADMPSSKITTKSAAAQPDLSDLPGHLIRRLQQIAVAVFLQETETAGTTPVQFAALHAVAGSPGIDQRTLAGQIGLDTSTVAGVVDRLEARGLLSRAVSSSDRRVRQLALTVEGQAVLAEMQPAMLWAR